jgi:hypothetical protein
VQKASRRDKIKLFHSSRQVAFEEFGRKLASFLLGEKKSLFEYGSEKKLA